MIQIQPADVAIIGTLILLEGLLSADNALVLALLVRHLPKDEQHKALLYGLVGAFVLRGIMIALASLIIGLWWLCGIGALYLIWLAVKHFIAKNHEETHAVPKAGMSFWKTVAAVEFTDIIFAVDSILVAVALVKDPDKIWIVYTGGFIGIVLLRVAAGFFIRLVRKYPTIDNMAYALVGWAGVKLAATSVEMFGDAYPQYAIAALEHGMPKPLFWSVFVLIVIAGILMARRAAPTPERQADSQAAADR